MLPSFRLIAVTFFCGFTVVFGALHFAKFLRSAHQSVPVATAQIVPPPPAVIPDRELRRGQASVPIMYDMRFATVSALPQSAGASPVTSRHLTVAVPQIAIAHTYNEEERLSEAGPQTEASTSDEIVIVASIKPIIKPMTTSGAAQRPSNGEPGNQVPSGIAATSGPAVVAPIPPPRPRLATLRAGEDLPEVFGLLPKPRGQASPAETEPAKPKRIRRPIVRAQPREEFGGFSFGYPHNSSL